MAEILRTDPLILALGTLLPLAWTLHKLVNMRRNGNNGSNGMKIERRRGMPELLQEIRDIRQKVEGNQDAIRGLYGRLDAHEADHRHGDKETARELGALGGTLKALMGEWARLKGTIDWRDRTPPDGTKPRE